MSEDTKTNITDTARKQIDLENERESAHENLERTWRKTVDDLANTPLPQPTLGPGFSDERSLKEKYDHYRTAHEQLVARTDRTFDESRSFIRANGTTPTRHFGEVAGPSGPYHPASAEPLKPAFQEAALQSDAPDQIRITNATAPPDLEHTHDQSRGRR